MAIQAFPWRRYGAQLLDPRYAPKPGQSCAPMYAFKAADQSVSATALADDTHLKVPIVNGGAYIIEVCMFWLAAATTTGIALSLNGPASPTYIRFGMVAPTTASATGAANAAVIGLGASAYNTILLGVTTPSTTVPYMAMMNGFLTNGANSGNLVVRIAGEAAPSITYQAGSWLRVTRVL